MAAATLRKEESLALGVALAAHAALFAWLAFARPGEAPLPLPQTMTVTLSDEVGLTSTAPEPPAQPSAAAAPELGEKPPPPEPIERAVPSPVPTPPVKVALRPVQKLLPKAALTLPPRPVPSGRPGAPKVGKDFLKGVAAPAGAGPAAPVPAGQIGATARAGLASAISRELKPKWVAPQGAEAEQLVTILAWDLNPDGTLSGNPRVVRQDGITEANRAQAPRHAEQAIRAVRLAAPFDLPSEFYNAWRRISAFRFDRKLSQ